MRVRLTTLVLAASLAVASPLAANPPPSAGGGGLSQSAPAYDPTKDYQAALQAIQAGKFKDADKLLNRVLDALPRDSMVLFLSGFAKAGNNDMKGAQRAYERSVRADAKNVDAHRELGLIYAKQGDAKKADVELKALQGRAEACKDTCPDAAKLKAALATVSAAIAAPKPSASLAPSMIFASASQGEGAYLQAVGLINTGRYEDAIATLKTAQLTFGPHPDVLTYLGYSNRKLGRLDEAETYYTAALKVAPDHRSATEYYGELKVERGDLAGARVLLARLEQVCAFGCAEEQELRRWIATAEHS